MLAETTVEPRASGSIIAQLRTGIGTHSSSLVRRDRIQIFPTPPALGVVDAKIAPILSTIHGRHHRCVRKSNGLYIGLEGIELICYPQLMSPWHTMDVWSCEAIF